MKSKLNLNIDKEIKEKAKRYAQRHGTSVSEMVEKFLESVSKSDFTWQPPESSVVSEIMGSIPNKDQRNYDEIIAEEIVKKFENI